MSKTDDNTGEQADELIEDLQSIRELLDDEVDNASAGVNPSTVAANSDAAGGSDPESSHAAQADSEAAPDEQVPLLDDVVAGGISLEEAPLAERSGIEHGEGFRLDDDLFQSLLGDSWRQSAGEILTEARRAINEHRNTWTPEDTDELSEALKVRIDATLNEWLKKTLRHHADELRRELIESAKRTIDEQIESVLNSHGSGK